MSPVNAPQSCDTFVVFSDKTKDGSVIFGKNSDRPAGEVQEVVYHAAADHDDGATVECTYITVPQVGHTHAVFLSKPSWLWGAEMGANERGVCAGNEAVWTNQGGEEEERLLGMDLVRLCLERASTADEAVTVISSLLAAHGQGGPCSETIPSLTYHNSFLLVDNSEAWVLETAGDLWAAERFTSGHRNISNCLTIGTSFQRSSDGLAEAAKQRGCWDGKGDFDFSKALSASDPDTSRLECGDKLLRDLSKDGCFDLSAMMKVLRDEDSGICMRDGGFISTGSQVSVLPGRSSNGSGLACHWMTGTPDPQRSVFKPFVFTPNARISPFIQSPKIEDDPVKNKPRFSRAVDRSHVLYRRRQAAYKSGGGGVAATLRQLEQQCIEETRDHLAALTGADSLAEVDDLFKDCVDSELKFYK